MLILRAAKKILGKMERNNVLAKGTVQLRDRVSITAVLKKLIESGAKKLQIITDFDHTLSKSKKTCGTDNCTTYRIFDCVANGVDPRLQAALRELSAKYYPIEMDPNLSVEEKLPHMLYWWTAAHDLISRAGFGKAILARYVEQAKVELRDGVLEFLRLCEQEGIPVVIFSAGIGDIIELILRQQYGCVPKNVHIISNMMQYNESDTIVGFLPPLIHTFNKNRTVIQGERPFFLQLKDRPNVLLMGDTLGDLNMDVGVVNEGAIVKIGFLNHHIEKSLQTYLAGYNIVLTDDQTFDVPLGILKSVISQKSD